MNNNPLENEALREEVLREVREAAKNLKISTYRRIYTLLDIAAIECEGSFGYACYNLKIDADWDDVPDADKEELYDVFFDNV